MGAASADKSVKPQILKKLIVDLNDELSSDTLKEDEPMRKEIENVLEAITPLVEKFQEIQNDLNAESESGGDQTIEDLNQGLKDI